MIDLYELAGVDQSVRFSPYCWRIRMALAHKGVPARIVPWHYGEKKLPGGKKQVPVLVDDGEVIGDSTAIALHLEHKYGNGPSLFGGEGGEAHARFIIAWTDTILHPAMLPVLAPDLLRLIKPASQAAFREAREARMGMSFEAARKARSALTEALRATLAPVRHIVSQADFLGGEEPTYADYAVFGALQWARCVSGPDILAAGDPVANWRDAMLDLFGEMARGAKRAA